MKILITGAEGFTGQHFLAQSKLRGHSISILQSNLNDVKGLEAEIQAINPRYVLHLAGISHVDFADVAELYKSNVLGTTNLLDALIKLDTPPTNIILASSANVYGNSTAEPIREDALTFPSNHYAMSKLAMEYMARNYLDRLPISFSRPFNYIGKGQSDRFVVSKLVSHFVSRSKRIELGNLDVEREFNDVEFVCEAYFALLEYAEPGEIYNICSGITFSLESIINRLTKLTGHNIEVAINPAFVRENEIKRLCGDPSKLQSLSKAKAISLPKISIEETLKKMIN